MKMLLAIPFLVLGAAAVQSLPEPPRSEEPHAWLQQLVGDWTVTTEITPPGGEPVRYESTESVRSIGELWTLAESTASFGDLSYTSVMTLGYDPRREEFVGTWIDSVQTHLWTYHGSLDSARKVLSLETEGPGPEDESKTARYRDVIELKSDDNKVLTSSVQSDDGTWRVIQRVEYRRKQ